MHFKNIMVLVRLPPQSSATCQRMCMYLETGWLRSYLATPASIWDSHARTAVFNIFVWPFPLQFQTKLGLKQGMVLGQRIDQSQFHTWPHPYKSELKILWGHWDDVPVVEGCWVTWQWNGPALLQLWGCFGPSLLLKTSLQSLLVLVAGNLLVILCLKWLIGDLYLFFPKQTLL